MLLPALSPWQAAAALDAQALARVEASVVRIEASRADGKIAFGSAVVIEPGTLVTNCHVTRWARKIEVIRGAQHWLVDSQSWDIEHDVCVLKVKAMANAVPPHAWVGELQVAQRVYAVGYPLGQQLSVNEGQVEALYGYDGAKVIRSSTLFSPGASGGGLFDQDGWLIGILAFKAPSGGPFHFALPVHWVDPVIANRVPATQRWASSAFWERPRDRQPYFLRAAGLEAAQDWGALRTLAEQWTRFESDSPEAWLALGRAAHHDQRSLGEAHAAIRHAARLRPKHAAILKELNLIEWEVSCSRYRWCS